MDRYGTWNWLGTPSVNLSLVSRKYHCILLALPFAQELQEFNFPSPVVLGKEQRITDFFWWTGIEHPNCYVPGMGSFLPQQMHWVKLSLDNLQSKNWSKCMGHKMLHHWMIKSQFLVLLKIDETCTFDAKFTCPLIWERHITFITTIFIMTMFTIYDEVLMGKNTFTIITTRYQGCQSPAPERPERHQTTVTTVTTPTGPCH